MAIAKTLSDYLDSKGITYSVLKHPHTSSSQETAEAAHVPGDQLAKSVVLHDGKGYVMAVIPATHKARLGAIGQMLGRVFKGGRIVSVDIGDEIGGDVGAGIVRGKIIKPAIHASVKNGTIGPVGSRIPLATAPIVIVEPLIEREGGIGRGA